MLTVAILASAPVAIVTAVPGAAAAPMADPAVNRPITPTAHSTVGLATANNEPSAVGRPFGFGCHPAPVATVLERAPPRALAAARPAAAAASAAAAAPAVLEVATVWTPLTAGPAAAAAPRLRRARVATAGLGEAARRAAAGARFSLHPTARSRGWRLGGAAAPPEGVARACRRTASRRWAVVRVRGCGKTASAARATSVLRPGLRRPRQLADERRRRGVGGWKGRPGAHSSY